jgi:hypothetical protein
VTRLEAAQLATQANEPGFTPDAAPEVENEQATPLPRPPVRDSTQATQIATQANEPGFTPDADVIKAIKAFHATTTQSSHFTTTEDLELYHKYHELRTQARREAPNKTRYDFQKNITVRNIKNDAIKKRVEYLRKCLNKTAPGIGDRAFPTPTSKPPAAMTAVRNMGGAPTMTPPVRDSASRRPNRNTGKRAGLHARCRSGGRERAGDATAEATGP